MEGKVALVIDDDSSHVVTTPILEDNQEHQIAIEHRLFIGNDGACEFRDSISLQGKFASAIRNKFFGRDVKEQEKLMEDFLASGMPDVSIGNIRIENLDEFNKPLALIVNTYASKGYFGQGGSELKGRFPNVWERSLFKLPKVAKRHHPIRMPHETQFSFKLNIKTASGHTVTLTEAKPLNRAPDYVSFEKLPKSKTSSGIKWTTFALYADPSEYDKIREEWNYLLSETSPMIVAVAAGAHLGGGFTFENAVLFFEFLEDAFRQFFLRFFGQGRLVADRRGRLHVKVLDIAGHLLLVGAVFMLVDFVEHDGLGKTLATFQEHGIGVVRILGFFLTPASCSPSDFGSRLADFFTLQPFRCSPAADLFSRPSSKPSLAGAFSSTLAFFFSLSLAGAGFLDLAGPLPEQASWQEPLREGFPQRSSLQLLCGAAPS